MRTRSFEEMVVGTAPRRLVDLTKGESLRLLGTVPFGRIVFTRQALPAVRLINHIIDEQTIIIHTHLGTGVHTAGGLVVAYEADHIDPLDRLGWSVIVTGTATAITDPLDIARYQRMLRPWVNEHRGDAIRIRPQLVTGYRLTRGNGTTTPPSPHRTVR